MVDPKSVAKKPDNEATLKQEEPSAGDPTNQVDGAGTPTMVDPKSVAKKPDNEATLKQEEPPAGDPTNQADGEHPVFEFVNSMTGPPTLDLNESVTARPTRPTMEINKSKTPKEMLRNYCVYVVRHLKCKRWIGMAGMCRIEDHLMLVLILRSTNPRPNRR